MKKENKMELNNSTKLEIINLRLEQWKQKLYSLKLDVKVANAIEDDTMLEAIKPEIKKCLAALELLGEEIEELDKE